MKEREGVDSKGVWDDALGQKLPVALRALRHRDFRIFFAGQLVSLIGTWMQSTAQAWLVWRLTKSGALLGLISFASQIPILVFGPLGGIAADLFNRRRIVIATQIVSMILALALAILSLTNQVQIWHVFVLAVMLGIVNSFDIPARQSFLVQLVGKPDLMNAIALNSSMFHGARIVGPAIAGLLIGLVGEGWCFLGNGLSYIAVILGLLFISVRIDPTRSANGSATSQIIEGFRYVGVTSPIRVLLVHVGLTSLLGVPFTVLLPIFADHILHGGVRGYGMLLGASGCGALAAALMLAARTKIEGLGRLVAISSAGFGISLVAFAHSKSFGLSGSLMGLIGFAMMVQMGSANTLVQAMVPDRLRGRVMAVYSMMQMGMVPLGSLLAGALESKVGAPTTVMLGGIACIASAAIFQARRKSIRPWAHQLIRDQHEESILTQTVTRQMPT